MKVQGVIVRITPYRECNAVINLLTQKGLITFSARNVYKANHQNLILSSPLLYGEFTFSDNIKNKLIIFKEVNPIVDTRNYINEYDNLVILNFINEITLRMFIEDDMMAIYPYLVNLLLAIKSNKNYPSLILAYLATALRLNGNSLNVDESIYSKTKENIVGVSFIDGGLVAREEFNPQVHKLYSPLKINILRKVFKFDAKDFNTINMPKKETIEVLKDLLIFTYDQTGVQFKSSNLIKNFL